MADARTVLITGCSSGIGRACAERLLHAGYRVVATARDPEDVADLAERGATTHQLDVTDEDSMRSAVQVVDADLGGVDALVNNAGYGEYGPVEELDMAAIRRQFETNVFGAIRLIQLVLPGMRHKGWGRIVNMSTMGGRITMPGGGAYHASKHALEAFTDPLRYEVEPFGIAVSLVEPGPVLTPWVETAVGTIDPPDEDDPYHRFRSGLQAGLASGYQGPMARLASSADDVARVVHKAIDASRPRPRYVVGAVARSLIATHALLPDRGWDLAMRSYYPRAEGGSDG